MVTIPNTRAGSGVAVGTIGVEVGGAGVEVGGAGVEVGGTAVAVVAAVVAVAATGVAVGGTVAEAAVPLAAVAVAPGCRVAVRPGDGTGVPAFPPFRGVGDGERVAGLFVESDSVGAGSSRAAGAVESSPLSTANAPTIVAVNAMATAMTTRYARPELVPWMAGDVGAGADAGGTSALPHSGQNAASVSVMECPLGQIGSSIGAADDTYLRAEIRSPRGSRGRAAGGRARSGGPGTSTRRKRCHPGEGGTGGPGASASRGPGWSPGYPAGSGRGP